MIEASSFKPEAILQWMSNSFDVDVDAGTLTWKRPPKQHPRLAGFPAGSARSGHSGKVYVVVKRNRYAFKRGWLIFLWALGRWPVGCIDHANGISTDDRIANLREATTTENAWNHHKRAKRAPLPMGVRVAGSGRFVARISVNKRQITIGTFTTVAAARAAYLAKRRECYGQFA